MLCPTCHAEQPAGNKFCEDCGARLGSPSPSAADDRTEADVSPALAGVSDRGPVKPRNEDRFAVAEVGGATVLVVCDGVSCSQQPHLAATAATAAVVATLRAADGDPAALPRAVAAADAAVRAIPFDRAHPFDPPETTVVAAVRRGDRLTVAWVGDSRAYLVGPTGVRRLTRDHNWRTHAVAVGELTPEKAAADPQARALTRTVGGRGDPDAAETAEATLAAGDRLVLCTDGVWDGVPDDRWPDLVSAGPAIDVARRLVDHAKRAGATDNLTAAVLIP